MTDKNDFGPLEDAVIKKLSKVAISEYHHDGFEFNLEKEGWRVQVIGYQGMGGTYTHLNQLSLIVIDSTQVDNPEVFDGAQYQFEGRKVEAFYESLLRRRKEYLQEQSEKEKKTRDQERNPDAVTLLEAFVGKRGGFCLE